MGVYRPHREGQKLAIRLYVALVFMFGVAASIVTVAQNRPDLSGNWIRMRGERGFTSDAEFTDAGKRRFDSYDFKKDDPNYACIGASWVRVWVNPGAPIRITQTPENVRIQYEFMDIDRRLPLVDAAAANPKRTTITRMPTLGSSTAWYDGDALVIDTINYAPGYIDTVGRAGMPQSRRMHTVERLRRSGDTLTLEIAHIDPLYYRKPFVVTFNYQKTDLDLMEYGCTPEHASIVAPR